MSEPGWSYELAAALMAALENCGLLSPCARIWPGCRPPVDSWRGDCDTAMWLTYTEGYDGTTVECSPDHRETIELTLWIKQCSPDYENGTLPDDLDSLAQDQSIYRTRILRTLANWAQTICVSSPCGCWKRAAIGAWECDPNKDGVCALRTLRITLTR